MKRLVLAAVIILTATALFAAQPAVGVRNTFHDLSLSTGYSVRISNAAASGVPANTLDQLCIWCHTPHHAIGSLTDEEGTGENIDAQLIPLWNHETTAATFDMYSTANNPLSDLQGTVAAAVEGGSLACLSCHDGTLALGAIRTNPYWANTKTYQNGVSVSGHVDLVTGQFTTSAYGYVGTDLTNDHPISITYQNNLDLALKDPSTFVGVKLFGAGGNITGNSVECGSCHNPHNYGTTGTTAPFLRASMAASALCLQCHTK